MKISQEETYTINEAVLALGLNGIHIGAAKLTALLKTGYYDWGNACEMNGHNEVLIFKKPMYEWLRKMCRNEVEELYEG